MELTYCVLRNSQTNDPFAVVGVAENGNDVHITFLKDTSVSFIVDCKPLYQLKAVKRTLEENGVTILPNGQFGYDFHYDSSIGKSQLPSESVHDIFELYKFQCMVYFGHVDDKWIEIRRSMEVFYIDTIVNSLGISDNIEVVSTGCDEVERYSVQAILEKVHELNRKVYLYSGIIGAIIGFVGFGCLYGLIRLFLQ